MMIRSGREAGVDNNLPFAMVYLWMQIYCFTMREDKRDKVGKAFFQKKK